MEGEGEVPLLVLLYVAGKPYSFASFLKALLLLSASESRLKRGSGRSPGFGIEAGSGVPKIEVSWSECAVQTS
jgi:hypothetical protein